MQPHPATVDGPGRANLTRLAFGAAGIAFTDKRIKMEDWPAAKADETGTPAKMFGSMPTIKVGGLMLAQSQAVASYAAELGVYAFGRLGATPALQAANRATDNMMLSTADDVKAALYKCLFGDGQHRRALARRVSYVCGRFGSWCFFLSFFLRWFML